MAIKGLLTIGLLGLLLLSAGSGCATNGSETADAAADEPASPDESAVSGRATHDTPLIVEPEPPEPAPEGVDLASLRKAVEDDPSDFESHRRLGIVLRRSGEEAEGLVHLERAAELAPDNVEPLLSLGIAYSGAGRLEDAEATYERIVKIDPSHSRALNNLGNIALRRGFEEKSIDWYRQAIEADPEYMLAIHRLAGVLKYYGHLDQAYPLFERVLEFEPSYPAQQHAIVDSMYNLGSINLLRENYELADKQLARVLRAVPHHRSAHYARAQALIQLGRTDEAQQELDRHMQILVASGEGY